MLSFILFHSASEPVIIMDTAGMPILLTDTVARRICDTMAAHDLRAETLDPLAMGARSYVRAMALAPTSLVSVL